MDGRSAAAVLGVSPGASRNEITRAFRAKAKVTHPDTTGSDDAFITLHRAYRALCHSAPGDTRPATPADGSRPHRYPSWVRPSPSGAAPSAVDLSDSPARSRRSGPGTAGGAISRPHRGPAAAPGPVRDRRGLTFDDHLRAQLAG